jgi:hypothetical protein
VPIEGVVDLYVLDSVGITYVGIGLLFHDRNLRLLDQILEPLDPTLEARDYEGVPWGDEDEDMASVRVGVEVVGHRSVTEARWCQSPRFSAS